MSKKVSIIIPFYNCPYVKVAIESALSQTYPNIEIILVDDGSTKHLDEVKPYLKRIKYIKKENGGTASALNRGIKEATGDYFCWLSSDDKFLPSKVERQLDFMDKNGLSASFTSFHFIDEKGEILSGPIGMVYPTKLMFYKVLRKGCPINGCTVMLEMRLFEKIGLFDEGLPYTHDYDLWLRLIQAEHLEYLNESLLHYRVHDEMGTKKHADVIKLEVKKVQKRHADNMRSLIKKEIAAMIAGYKKDKK